MFQISQFWDIIVLYYYYSYYDCSIFNCQQEKFTECNTLKNFKIFLQCLLFQWKNLRKNLPLPPTFPPFEVYLFKLQNLLNCVYDSQRKCLMFILNFIFHLEFMTVRCMEIYMAATWSYLSGLITKLLDRLCYHVRHCHHL